MTEQLHKMLAFVLENDVGLTKTRARSCASYFADIEEFLEASREVFSDGFKSITGQRVLSIAKEDIDKIQKIRQKGLISSTRSVRENYLEAIGRHFTRRQLDMIKGLQFSDLNPNPFLISALGLKTPREVVHINVYMRAGRSIVTSMGYFVQDLLLASSETVEKVSKTWDVVKKDEEGEKHWIQVKSGPNDMDLDQIRYWTEKIADIEEKGDRGYIGITYGKRSLDTVTFNLMQSHMDDWGVRTLIGRELWDFVADDPRYHEQLFDILREAATQILKTHTFVREIESCVDRLEKEFIDAYGSGEEGVQKYLTEIL